jgi:transposase
MVLDALFFRLRNTGPWRDLPEAFDPWRTIYGWHRLWAREGLWTRMFTRMACKVRSRIRLVDGTHVRLHQCPAYPKGGAAAQAMGKTRGGRNTKIVALTDERGLPVVGDKGFDDDNLRQRLEELGAAHCFPSKSNCKRSAGSTRGSIDSATG